MPRKAIFIFIATVLTIVPLFAQGKTGRGYGPGMTGVYYYNRDILDKSPNLMADLSKIRKGEGLKEGASIDPDKVGPALLAELGDDVMDVVIGNKQGHEWMDNMMGGEGSPSLDYMHRLMGYRYLAGFPIGMGMMGWGYGPAGGYYFMPGYGRKRGWCPLLGYSSYSTNNINNFWKGGHMMWNWGYGPGMMGGWYGGWGGMFMGLIFLIVLILAIYLIVRAARGHGLGGSPFNESPLDILKKRYAKGEISKDDFEKMKKDLS